MAKREKKPKQDHKNKEQLLREAEIAKETKRQRELVKQYLYPITVKASISIADASQFLQVLLMSVRQKFQSQMLTQTIGDLKLVEQIDPKAPRADYFKEFLDILINENVSTVTKLIEGLSDEFDRLIKKELNERKLDTLKTDFID